MKSIFGRLPACLRARRTQDYSTLQHRRVVPGSSGTATATYDFLNERNRPGPPARGHASPNLGGR